MALIAAFAAGTTFIMLALTYGFVQPPGVEENASEISRTNSTVREHTTSIDSFDERLLGITNQGEHIICLLTLPEGTTPLEAERVCN